MLLLTVFISLLGSNCLITINYPYVKELFFNDGGNRKVYLTGQCI